MTDPIELDPETIPGFMQARFVFRLVKESINKTKAVYGEKCVKDYEQRAFQRSINDMLECILQYANSRGESVVKYESLLR